MISDYAAFVVKSDAKWNNLKDLSDFPTAKEQDIDVTFVNWRGFFGPPDMDANALAYYQRKFKELHESPAWDAMRKKYGWSSFYMEGEEYRYILSDHFVLQQGFCKSQGYLLLTLRYIIIVQELSCLVSCSFIDTTFWSRRVWEPFPGNINV